MLLGEELLDKGTAKLELSGQWFCSLDLQKHNKTDADIMQHTLSLDLQKHILFLRKLQRSWQGYIQKFCQGGGGGGGEGRNWGMENEGGARAEGPT